MDPGLPTLVLIFSAGMKAGMFFAIRGIARQLNSPTLNTTAMDNLSDVLTSLAAFAGVVGSQLLNPLADPLAGLLVAAWIFRAVFRAGKKKTWISSPELGPRAICARKSRGSPPLCLGWNAATTP